MITPPQRGMNAREAIRAAVDFYANRTPNGAETAQVSDVIAVATKFAEFMDKRTDSSGPA